MHLQFSFVPLLLKHKLNIIIEDMNLIEQTTTFYNIAAY
jgi:hypothetical protein